MKETFLLGSENHSLNSNNLLMKKKQELEKKYEEAEVYRTERFFGKFQRTVTLPAAVAADKVKAQYKDGVLTVTLPKAEEARPKQIDISVN